MNKKMQKLQHFRHFILRAIEHLTVEQLNKIPEGYTNNIIWNLGHLVASTQLIFYMRAGMPVTIADKYILPFVTNTYPTAMMDETEVDKIKELALSTIRQMAFDYGSKDFSHYVMSENIERVYGTQLQTIDDAIEFLLYHEGYHSGKIITIKQLVEKIT